MRSVTSTSCRPVLRNRWSRPYPVTTDVGLAIVVDVADGDPHSITERAQAEGLGGVAEMGSGRGASAVVPEDAQLVWALEWPALGVEPSALNEHQSSAPSPSRSTMAQPGP